MTRRHTDRELRDLESIAPPSGGWRHRPGGGLDLFTLRRPGDEVVQLLAPRETGEAIVRALEAAREEVPALAGEVRRLREELERARAEARPAAAVTPPRSAPAALDADDEPLGLAAAFRVGPREAKAAKDDPLVALAVQVARAMAPDAKEVERARLLAMALAASRGDLEGFWAARRMRTVRPAGGQASRKK